MEKQTYLQLLKTGNEEAYRELYNSHRESFMAFASKHNLGRDDVIDIYQESFIILYENIVNGKLTELRSSLKTYLFSIGKFKIYERLRANKKMVMVEGDLWDVNISEELEYNESTLNVRQLEMKKYFSKLGDRCKNILQLFYLDQLSINEIRLKEGYENANTVKAHKSRCLRQLKSMINN